MVDIVNGLLLRNDQVLMARRCANRRLYPGKWSFPGGHVEEGETLEQALTRELIEELGVLVNSAWYLSKLETSSGDGQEDVLFHFFVIADWDGDPANLGTEHSELRWVPLVEARAMPNLALQSYRQVFARLMTG